MYRDPSKFRDHFKLYKDGKSVREIYGLPGYAPGKVSEPSPDEAFVESMGPLLYRELLYQGVKNPDVVYKNLIAQLAYESDRGRSRVARELHNYGGVGWNGKTYFNYKNDADFVHDYVKLMNRRYKTAILADTLYDYAKGIKKLGYFEDTLENYSRNLIGMKSLHKAALAHKMANPELYKVEKIPTQQTSPIVAAPVSTRVTTTIPQEKTIPIIDPRNATIAEAERAIWAHNVMEDMKGAYQVPIWESPSLPALTPVEYDVTPLKTYAGGKLPRYQNGRGAVILQGRKQLPIDKAEAATEPDYNEGWFLTTIKRGVNNAIKTVKDQVRAARNIINGRGSLGDYIEVGIDALTGAAGKLLSGSAKEAKHVAKRTLKPTQASTKKFNTKDPNKVGAYYSAHPDEVTPITNNLDVKEVVNFMNNHVGPKYYKLNGVHVGIDPNDIKLGYADLSGSNLGGYVGPSGEVVINKDILNNRDLLRYVLGHEIAGHWFDLHYPLTVPQMSTVGYGMPFKQDFLAERPWFNAIKEANAERRAFLLMTYFDKGVLGEDLDEAIKHMAKAEAKRYIDRLGYARGIDWQWPDILPFKQAVTSVPASASGLYLAGNEEYKDGKLPGYSNGKIRIKPSKRGTFTAAAKKHGASVREFESRVLKNPEKYSTAMVKKARFSRNARSWKH